MSRHLMLMPSLACPASCTYCFGPHEGSPAMGLGTLVAIADWQNALDETDEPLEITFHGGEPLVPGFDFYRLALPRLRDQFRRRDVRFGVQSNLWFLNDDLCDLFVEYGVSIGTSLDGPGQINDAQRGEGYFRRTMAGIDRARAHGLGVGCICTFTSFSISYVEQVFDFFVREGLDFSIHPALPVLGRGDNGWMLSPETHGHLLVDLLNRYLDNTSKIRISSLDAMCRSIAAQRGGICTFGDCLGEYLAVDPEGWIYTCQRFAGMPQYRLGNVHDRLTMEDLATTPFWRVLQERQERVEAECGDCPYLAACRGGCPYNVMAANNGGFDETLRDPHCTAYRRVFGAITDRALEEVFSDENMAAVVKKGPDKRGLLQEGKLLPIMSSGPHPKEVARRAREVVAAAALAVSNSPVEALHKLDRAGIVTQPARALQSLTALRERLDTQSQDGLANAYIHVTHGCNLTCSHCYAGAGPDESSAMAVSGVMRLVWQAKEVGFRKAVVTGGEPVMHPQRDPLLDALVGLREQVKPLRTVLRTNLAYPLPPTLLERLAHSTDQVLVSIDGDEASHDLRRGVGTYARTVANLRALLANNPRADVGISTVLTAEQTAGLEGDAVRALGEELDVPVRFKSVLPLGRGAELALKPTFYSSLDDGIRRLAQGPGPASTCGLGMNLYVKPDGTCYPCYALTSRRHRLGNAFGEGLATALKRNDAYRHFTADTNRKCSQCPWRYLCGGFCRAWCRGSDPDAPLLDCTALQDRARDLLMGALSALNASTEHWVAAGLPLAANPTGPE